VPKDQIARFGVSLSRALLNQLDRMVRKKGYRNRSLAISDMIRDHLVGHQQELGDSEMAGTITLVYNHHDLLCHSGQTLNFTMPQTRR
jgi:CopG family transcriptional regulator, nickel-responsive regulator